MAELTADFEFDLRMGGHICSATTSAAADCINALWVNQYTHISRVQYSLSAAIGKCKIFHSISN